MLDGLEGPDRAAELDALLRVLNGEVEAALRATDLLRGDRDERSVERPREQLPAAARLAEQRFARRPDATETDLALAARLVGRRRARLVTPAASAGSAKRLTPSSPEELGRRAATTRRSALAPSGTNVFTPSRTKASPSARAVAVIAWASQRPFSSV
jgi:hypothetical protein